MSNLLFDWLRANAPDDTVPSYMRVDIFEDMPFSSEIAGSLAAAIVDARVQPAIADSLAKRLTKPKYAELIKALTVPTSTLTRRGDFGEILAACCMERLLQFHLPVKKLRYTKMRPNDQPRGIDFVALKLTSSGRIAEVCYVESKLRTGSDKTYAIEAHDQLRDIWAVASNDFHLFILNVLAGTADPLLSDFADFMAGSSLCSTTFCLSLHADLAEWEDETLKRLADLPPTLKPLTILVCRIARLKERIESAFSILGLVESEEDD